jgi:hypothetical protein
MSHHEALYPLRALSEWTDTVSSHMPHLSKAQAHVLALFSLGMVLSRSCAISAVALVLGPLLCTSPNTLRQRLREFCYEKEHKRGAFRTEIDAATCFAPLLSWILSLWHSGRLALALDATYLKDRFIVLCISVLYNGSAIPVAWTVVSASDKHAWKPEWQRLLGCLQPAVPKEMQVIVLADRGLYARWLFRHIQSLGWHPLLRVHARGSFCPRGKARFLPFRRFAPSVGTCFAATGDAFSTPEARLSCTLLARWDEGHDEPMLILTDLSPRQSDALWYGVRSWIERGFKSIKRGGFQWQNTRMEDPNRAQRLWLAVAVATLWLLSAASEPPDALFNAPLFTYAWIETASGRSRPQTRLRLCSLFRLGLAVVLAALIRNLPLPNGRFFPQQWPKATVTTNHVPITYP